MVEFGLRSVVECLAAAPQRPSESLAGGKPGQRGAPHSPRMEAFSDSTWSSTPRRLAARPSGGGGVPASSDSAATWVSMSSSSRSEAAMASLAKASPPARSALEPSSACGVGGGYQLVDPENLGMNLQRVRARLSSGGSGSAGSKSPGQQQPLFLFFYQAHTQCRAHLQLGQLKVLQLRDDVFGRSRQQVYHSNRLGGGGAGGGSVRLGDSGACGREAGGQQAGG